MDDTRTLEQIGREYKQRRGYAKELKRKVDRAEERLRKAEESNKDLYKLFEAEAKLIRSSLGCSVHELTLREFELNYKYEMSWLERRPNNDSIQDDNNLTDAELESIKRDFLECKTIYKMPNGEIKELKNTCI